MFDTSLESYDQDFRFFVNLDQNYVKLAETYRKSGIFYKILVDFYGIVFSSYYCNIVHDHKLQWYIKRYTYRSLDIYSNWKWRARIFTV